LLPLPHGLPMDRRSFTFQLSVLGLGIIACREVADPTSAVGLPPGPPNAPPPVPPPVPIAAFPTAADRAFGVVAGLAASAEPVGDGVRWPVMNAGARTYPADLYAGQAGVLVFLCEAYRVRPTTELQILIERGATWLAAQPRAQSHSLFDGNGGRVWAFLSLHELFATTTSRWLDEALRLAPAIASWRPVIAGDLIAGGAGQGLVLLRLHEVTRDARWLTAARDLGAYVLTQGVAMPGGGLKFPSAVLNGQTLYYPGLAHGAAGTGYFLARLAQALPVVERAAYVAGAEAVARWLTDGVRSAGDAANWYRREPDQMSEQQVQWCHGAPGIGVFFAEMYRMTREARHLELARRCAVTVDREGSTHGLACLCHGVAGNAGLYMKLHRETGDAAWMDRAAGFSDAVWARRIRTASHPAWPSGDGNNVDNPGLMTGTAGVGWYYLQLAVGGGLTGPVTT